MRLSSSTEAATATIAVLVALVKAMIEKNVLSNAEVRVLLTKAANDLGPDEYTAPGKGAMGIILDDILPIFPEDGGD